MATVIVGQPICICGSTAYQEHPCYHDVNGIWRTRAEKLANPGLVFPSLQKCLWVPDTSWYTCVECKNDLNPDVVNGELERIRFKHKKEGKVGWTFTEVVGVGVFNSNGLELEERIP